MTREWQLRLPLYIRTLYPHDTFLNLLCLSSGNKTFYFNSNLSKSEARSFSVLYGNRELALRLFHLLVNYEGLRPTVGAY